MGNKLVSRCEKAIMMLTMNNGYKQLICNLNIKHMYFK